MIPQKKDGQAAKTQWFFDVLIKKTHARTQKRNGYLMF
jgi:hypothetical protein